MRESFLQGCSSEENDGFFMHYLPFCYLKLGGQKEKREKANNKTKQNKNTSKKGMYNKENVSPPTVHFSF